MASGTANEEKGERSAAPLIEFRGVGKRFGDVVAAESLNLKVRAGEFLSFLGPSGCGKTTALRMIAGFEQPSEGDVLIGGENMNGVPAYRRPVNMVFQHYALFPHLDVAGNVAYGLQPATAATDPRRASAKGRRGARDGAARRLRAARAPGSSPAASSSAWRWRAR